MNNPFTTEFRPPRRLRVFAFDPATARKFSNRDASIVTISIPYEMDPSEPNGDKLGPSGTYFEVIDYDPASGVFYKPIDLNDEQVWLNDGLAPSAENPKFHQQMVYAVAMNTVAVFEEALGRSVLWASSSKKVGKVWKEEFVQQLRIYPHALREANAFYNPAKKALLFGYFDAPANSSSAPAGTTIFTCLSHDIVVHETVHAILDGMHPRFAENCNPDMRALHEAFADIVALFQLFSFPEVLEDQIGKTRGDLERQSLLGELAQELGQAIGRGHALRDFLGGKNEDTGQWELKPPSRDALHTANGAHARGAVLVAAVFRAFLTIYKHRTADLFRIASNGTGILRTGEIDPDLKKRLAAEAAQCARRVLRICIRAMDYTPPVNVNFGDYLRAIITADHDLFPDDVNGYRAAFIEAFTAWGITPSDVSILSEKALLWPTLSEAEENRQSVPEANPAEVTTTMVQKKIGWMLSDPIGAFSDLSSSVASAQTKAQQEAFQGTLTTILNEQKHLHERMQGRMSDLADALPLATVKSAKTSASTQPSTNFLEIADTTDRVLEYHAANYYKRLLWLLISKDATPEFLDLIGIAHVNDPDNPMGTLRRSSITGLPSLHVHSVRIAKRHGQRSKLEREYVIELIQTRRGYFDPKQQEAEDARPPSAKDNSRPHDFKYRAGVTFLIDAQSFAIRRLIRSRHSIYSEAGLQAHRAHLTGEETRPNNAFYSGTNPGSDQAFTDLHRHSHSEDSFG